MKCLKLCQNICPIFSILFSFGKWGEATYRKTLHAQRLLMYNLPFWIFLCLQREKEQVRISCPFWKNRFVNGGNGKKIMLGEWAIEHQMTLHTDSSRSWAQLGSLCYLFGVNSLTFTLPFFSVLGRLSPVMVDKQAFMFYSKVLIVCQFVYNLLASVLPSIRQHVTKPSS